MKSTFLNILRTKKLLTWNKKHYSSFLRLSAAKNCLRPDRAPFANLNLKSVLLIILVLLFAVVSLFIRYCKFNGSTTTTKKLFQIVIETMSWRKPNSSHKDQIDIFCGIGYGEHQLGIVFITWQKLDILFLGYRPAHMAL